MRTTTISTQHLASTIFVICVYLCTVLAPSGILTEFLLSNFLTSTKHWVMSHDSAKHKQNGVNYIWSESSNRLVPVALYGQVIVWSQNSLYIMTPSHWVTGHKSHYSDTQIQEACSLGQLTIRTCPLKIFRTWPWSHDPKFLDTKC